VTLHVPADQESLTSRGLPMRGAPELPAGWEDMVQPAMPEEELAKGIRRWFQDPPDLRQVRP